MQLGTNSVNSEPKPNSISRNPYSHVEDAEAAAALALMLLTYDEVSECVADEIVESVVKVAVEEEVHVLNAVLLLLLEANALVLVLEADVDCTVVKVPLMATAGVCIVLSVALTLVVVAAVTGTGVAVAGFVIDNAGGNMAKRSLLLSGSSADWDDKLSTELQLIERVESSSA